MLKLVERDPKGCKPMYVALDIEFEAVIVILIRLRPFYEGA
jgi:hypothetical protein